eukprot:jgi/Ulvmu1/7969/UM004_0202.1
MAVALPLLLAAPEADATGLESFDLPAGPTLPNPAKGIQERSAKALEQAEEEFQNSDLLSILKANSEENKQKNKRAIENKYCQRQAELGVGDCGGLRFIPGATKSGKQRTPEWLAKLLGIEPQSEETLDLFKD